MAANEFMPETIGGYVNAVWKLTHPERSERMRCGDFWSVCHRPLREFFDLGYLPSEAFCLLQISNGDTDADVPSVL